MLDCQRISGRSHVVPGSICLDFCMMAYGSMQTATTEVENVHRELHVVESGDCRDASYFMNVRMAVVSGWEAGADWAPPTNFHINNNDRSGLLQWWDAMTAEDMRFKSLKYGILFFSWSHRCWVKSKIIGCFDFGQPSALLNGRLGHGKGDRRTTRKRLMYCTEYGEITEWKGQMMKLHVLAAASSSSRCRNYHADKVGAIE